MLSLCLYEMLAAEMLTCNTAAPKLSLLQGCSSVQTWPVCEAAGPQILVFYIVRSGLFRSVLATFALQKYFKSDFLTGAGVVKFWGGGKRKANSHPSTGGIISPWLNNGSGTQHCRLF